METMREEPALTIPTDEILDRLGPNGEHWIKGSWSDNSGLCLHQGVRVCQSVPGDAFLIERVADRYGWGTSFNDADSTTFDDVKQALVAHREIFPDEMKATFGPNWALVSQLVRRAAVLTLEQISDLAAAWVAEAAGAAARAAAAAAVAAARAARAAEAAVAAARAAGAAVAAEAAVAAVAAASAASAARAAAEGADEGAARAAAEGADAARAAWAAEAAARAAGAAVAAEAAVAAARAARAARAAAAAAEGAARAVACKNLVGQHGFTQEHYDTLTGPWRTVFPEFDSDD